MNSSNTINFPSPNFSGHEFSNQVSNRTLVRGVPKGETLLAERSATAVNADGIREEVKVSAADNEIVKKTSEAGFTKCMRKLGVNPHQHPEKVDATSNAVELTTPGSKRSAEIVPRSLCMKNEKSDLNASGLSFLPKKCMVRLAFARLFQSDEGSLHKCIRPLASGLRLQPGHDEIRTQRSQ